MKTEKSKKLRGSVLLTVVSVMSLLIIFLSGTLVLASAANNRAHINYSSAQAGITSRAVADAALKAISDEAHPEYASAILSLDSSSAPIKVPISINSSSTNTGTFGNIQDVTIEYAGTKKYYNEDSKVWEEKDLLKFTSNVTLGGVTSTTTSYVVKDPPQPPGGDGGGAGFVTTGGATFDDKAVLYGGSYINIPNAGDITGYDYHDPSTYRTNTEFHFQNNTSGFEADTVINGDLSIENMQYLLFPGKGKGVSIWGDLILSPNAASHMQYTSLLKDEDFDSSHPIDFNQIPYLYVDGAIRGKADGSGGGNDNMLFGNKSDPFPLNVFCDHIVAKGNGFEACADIYCMNPDETSEISITGSGAKLYEWTSSVLNKTDNSVSSETRGSFYSKGSLKVSNKLSIAGDLRIAGDLVVNGELKVGGNIVVGGKLTINSGGSCKELYCNDVEVVGSQDFRAAGKKVYTNALSKLKEGYTSVENRYVYAYSMLKEGYTEYENNLGDFDAVPNAKYEYELDHEEDMGGWFKKWYRDKFGNVYEWNPPGEYYYVEVDAEGNEVGTSRTDKEYSYFNRAGDRCVGDEVYYLVTDCDGNETDEVTNEMFSYYYEDDSPVSRDESYYQEGYYQVNSDGNFYDPMTCLGTGNNNRFSYFDSDGGIVSESDALLSETENVRPISEYGTDIYPKYAERDVILGLEVVDGIPKEQTQIVKTMEDILEGVINPYDNAQLPNAMNTKLTNLRTTNSPKYTPDSMPAEVDGHYLVNDSCILATGSISKDIVFSPIASDILVLIKDFGIATGSNIYIDDSTGHNVYFYIEDGVHVELRGNAYYTTYKYRDLFESGEAFQVYTDSSYARRVGSTEDPKPLSAFGISSPNWYIYGGPGSVLDISQYKVMTANILSPYLTVNIYGSGKIPNVVYYNGHKKDANNSTFIGCMNAGGTTLQNTMDYIYVPNSSSPPPVPTPDLSHWFKVLYYDEY